MFTVKETRATVARRSSTSPAALGGATWFPARRHVTEVADSDGWIDTHRTRRVMNVGVAALALILTAPLFLLIALLVAVTSRGPVFYRQLRVGIDRRRPDSDNGHWRRQVNYGGRLFRIWKFRTMYVGADRDGEVWAQPGDPRVTPIGRILRKYRLDELPQLFNVIAGDMNIVGPRPEQPNIFIQLRREIEDYPRRQRVLPGITGWAQIHQQYDQSVEDVRRKVALDLEYIGRQSVGEDLRIMARTIPVMLTRQGAL
ncbi:MAG: sugar transferase [Gemmatimonadota bacterium]